MPETDSKLLCLSTKPVKEQMRLKLPSSVTITDEGVACMTAALEYAACELLEVAANIARSREGKAKGVKITAEDVDNSLNTPLLGELFR